MNLGTGERTLGYRYVESALPVDEPVYVLGVVSNRGIGAPATHEEGGGFIISYRSKEQLQKKYTKDALVLGHRRPQESRRGTRVDLERPACT